MNYRIDLSKYAFEVTETTEEADGEKIFDSLGAARNGGLLLAREERSHWADRVRQIREFNLGQVTRAEES